MSQIEWAVCLLLTFAVVVLGTTVLYFQLQSLPFMREYPQLVFIPALATYGPFLFMLAKRPRSRNG